MKNCHNILYINITDTICRSYHMIGWSVDKANRVWLSLTNNYSGMFASTIWHYHHHRPSDWIFIIVISNLYTILNWAELCQMQKKKNSIMCQIQWDMLYILHRFNFNRKNPSKFHNECRTFPTFNFISQLTFNGSARIYMYIFHFHSMFVRVDISFVNTNTKSNTIIIIKITV